MNSSEVAACRTALGALQWLAVQTQPQLCSRYNLLLTEVVTKAQMQTAREIQQMIAGVRNESYHLEFFKLRRFCPWVTRRTPTETREIRLALSSLWQPGQKLPKERSALSA